MKTHTYQVITGVVLLTVIIFGQITGLALLESDAQMIPTETRDIYLLDSGADTNQDGIVSAVDAMSAINAIGDIGNEIWNDPYYTDVDGNYIITENDALSAMELLGAENNFVTGTPIGSFNVPTPTTLATQDISPVTGDFIKVRYFSDDTQAQTSRVVIEICSHPTYSDQLYSACEPVTSIFDTQTQQFVPYNDYGAIYSDFDFILPWGNHDKYTVKSYTRVSSELSIKPPNDRQPLATPVPPTEYPSERKDGVDFEHVYVEFISHDEQNNTAEVVLRLCGDPSFIIYTVTRWYCEDVLRILDDQGQPISPVGQYGGSFIYEFPYGYTSNITIESRTFTSGDVFVSLPSP